MPTSLEHRQRVLRFQSAFARSLLNVVHADVRKAFPKIKNIIAACGVTNHLRGNRPQWFAEIDVPSQQPFSWEGRADSATEARAKAWQAFLNERAPGFMAVA